MPDLRSRIGWQLRRLADRIDHPGAPKLTHWSFTFEARRGIVFRDDGKGCPAVRILSPDGSRCCVAYLGGEEYEKAHAEADNGL